MKGVDVSIFNGVVDWRTLKANGIDFAICRTGFGKYGCDETFARNIHDAQAEGLICGAYHYSYALTPADAAQEAEFCKHIINDTGCLLELPVFFDMEDADNWKARHDFDFSRRNVTMVCQSFIDNIRPLICGIYASYSWLEQLIDWRSLNCPVWNAQWGPYDFIQGYLWQYTDKLFINGRQFDANILRS